MKPYGLCADLHFHPWSAFATTNSEGLNGRLMFLLDEMNRMAMEVRKAGGDTIYAAGDIFHVRGSIAPLVLNPVKDCFKSIIDSGINIVLVAGNHDAELKDVTRLSSAITALEDIGCVVINEPGRIGDLVLVPWLKSVEELKKTLEDCEADERTDLIIHAPIDDVIPGLPSHGLDADYLDKLGFRRVFAGHYHNHKDFGNGVYSIGALAHHTWSDVGSKAGFLIVSESEVKWFKSHAPEFIEVTEGMDKETIEMLVDGNYVRAKLNTSRQSEVEEARSFLMDCGAKGVVILAQKEESAIKRTGSAIVKAGMTLDASVGDFIKTTGYKNPAELAVLCGDILAEARAVEA